MNSGRQHLYMLPSFRRALVAVEHTGTGREDSVLYQLQLTLASLATTMRATYSPKALAGACRMDGRPLNVCEQKDVDEFLTTLLDQVAQELKPTARARFCSSVGEVPASMSGPSASSRLATWRFNALQRCIPVSA